MSRPLIGITTDYDDPQVNYASPCSYSAAVEKACGLPLLLPYRTDLSLIGQYIDLLDGIVLSRRPDDRVFEPRRRDEDDGRFSEGAEGLHRLR